MKVILGTKQERPEANVQLCSDSPWRNRITISAQDRPSGTHRFALSWQENSENVEPIRVDAILLGGREIDPVAQ